MTLYRAEGCAGRRTADCCVANGSASARVFRVLFGPAARPGTPG